MNDLKVKMNALSRTEKVVFNHLTDLKTHAEIADELGMQVRTVKFHCGNIYKKLGINSCKAGSNSKRMLFTRLVMDFKLKEECAV